MNKKTDIERMVMEAHYLDALEIESSASKPLSEMEREEYINEILGLRSMVAELKTTLRTMALSLDTLNKSVVKKDAMIENLTATIEQLNKMIETLKDRNAYHNKNTFGDKSLKRKNKGASPKNRIKEKEDYDGNKDENNEGTGTGESSNSEGIDRTKVKSEHLDRNDGPRGPYTRMDAAQTITLQSGTSALPADARIVARKYVEEYTKESYVLCTRFEMLIYIDSKGERHEYYEPLDKKDTRRPYENTLPGTHGSFEFVSDLIVDNIQVGIPNHREGIRMLIDKFTSCENTRKNWLHKAAKLFKKLLPVFKARLLKLKSVVNIDETWCKVRIKFQGDGSKLGRYFNKYVWILVNKIEGVVYYLYDNDENDSRGHRPIHNFLGDFAGTIQSDGYNVYKQLAYENPDLEHILCWAHVRAKFKYADELSHDPDAAFFLDNIGLLYLMEAEYIMGGLSYDEIRVKRQRKEVTKILNGMYRKAKHMLDDKRLHYSDYMHKALTYMVNGWEDLLKYRNDGRYTIDNMLAERAVRPFVVTRKSSMHFSSEEGVEDAMTFYTIIETVKMYTTHVKDYLAQALRWLAAGNEDYETIAPWVLYNVKS